MTRYEYNKKILNIIKNEIEKNKDLRFIQLLWNLNIIDHEDHFYEESKETFDKLNGENK